MSELALGLIETRGLIASLEAADAALKAADVKLISKDRVDGALVTIKLTGDVAAVQAAVEAGAAAAQRIGVLVATHVIARPDESIHDSLAFVTIDSKKKNKKTDEADAGSSGGNASEPEVTTDVTLLKQRTVEELRRMARKVEGFPIQGREISRANKEELIQLICQYAA